MQAEPQRGERAMRACVQDRWARARAATRTRARPGSPEGTQEGSRRGGLQAEPPVDGSRHPEPRRGERERSCVPSRLCRQPCAVVLSGLVSGARGFRGLTPPATCFRPFGSSLRNARVPGAYAPGYLLSTLRVFSAERASSGGLRRRLLAFDPLGLLCGTLAFRRLTLPATCFRPFGSSLRNARVPAACAAGYLLSALRA